MNFFKRISELHFKKSYQGDDIFYPWSFGYGYIVKEKNYKESIIRFLLSYYLLSSSTVLSCIMIIGIEYSFLIFICFICIYIFVIRSYLQGLSLSKSRLTFQDFITIRAEKLNTIYCYICLSISAILSIIFLISFFLFTKDNLYFFLASMISFVLSYIFIRILIVKKHQPLL